MTRINLVPPSELYDQHLFAEWREIKMVPRSLERSLAARGIDGVRRMIPQQFTLNTGHVSFFYDKGAYLRHRYELLTEELIRRGYDFNRNAPFDPNGIYNLYLPLMGWYTPTPEAFATIRQRIAEKIALKPHWYTMSPWVHTP